MQQRPSMATWATALTRPGAPSCLQVLRDAASRRLAQPCAGLTPSRYGVLGRTSALLQRGTAAPTQPRGLMWIMSKPREHRADWRRSRCALAAAHWGWTPGARWGRCVGCVASIAQVQVSRIVAHIITFLIKPGQHFTPNIRHAPLAVYRPHASRRNSTTG